MSVQSRADTSTTWTLGDTEQSIPRRFAEQVARDPGKAAIAGTAWEPTFEELDVAAEGIARALAERNGNGPVALLMDHDAPLIAAMLGALKAGQPIVSLNPGDPPGRLDRIRRQVEPWLAVVDLSHRDLARRAGFGQIHEVHEPGPAARPDAHPTVEPAELAAVMFTSGSTGRPKGVMHTHHTLLHTALRHSTGLGLRSDDRVALLAAPSGGHGMGTTWMTLLSGATLCPFPVMDRGVAGLPTWLRENRVSVLGLSASLFRRLLQSLDGAAFPDLRLVRLGSEQIRRAEFDGCRRQIGEHCTFANVYSLTEAGGLSHAVIDPGEEPPPGPLPIGRAAVGVELLVLNERGDPVGPGERGEIVARSPHLSPGYWADPELTAERFSETSGARELRTGDVGLLNEDGDLVIAGRRDAQVKIRGYRVEIDEVESALRALPQIDAAAANAEPTRHGDSRLTAYLVARADPPPAPAELRDSLRATLAESSIPTVFAFVEELPLNSHGKVDRNRLAELGRPTAAGAESRPPATELERELSELWAEALELDRVGRDDDFFDVGGDSLAAAEIGAGVHTAFGVELDMRAFARHPTVTGMARLVRRLRRRSPTEMTAPAPVPRNGPLPCSFAQERIWEFARDERSAGGYTVVGTSTIDAEADIDALRSALAQVASRHEPLRTTFTERDGVPFQVVRPAEPVEVRLTDVIDTGDPAGAAGDLLWKEAQAPFDLEHGPLIRLHLARIADDRHLLLRVSHHLVSDRLSWRIFFRELIPAYEAFHHGRSPELSEPPIQYADFAAWQRRSLSGSRYREQVDWWRHALAPPPPRLELPFQRATAATEASPADAFFHWGIDPSTAAALDRLGREQRATHYAVRLALFSALLALETSQERLTIGAYADTRRQPGTREMFGYFSNLIPLVLPFDPSASLRAWVAKVGFLLVEAIAHGDLQHQLLREELAAADAPAPEIDAIFAVRYPLPELPFGDVEPLLPNPRLLNMPWGFTFTVDQADEAGRCLATFDARVHDPAEVRRFIDRYVTLAELAGANPDRPLGSLYPALR